MIYEKYKEGFMKIVATSDTHFPVDISMVPDGDVFIHAGDFMQSGYLSEWYPALEWLERLPHKKKYLILGNHDIHVEHYPGPALQYLRKIGVEVLGMPGNSRHQSAILPNGMSILGIAGVTNLPRWAFNRTEEELEAYLKDMPRHDIVVSHAPPHKMLDGTGRAHIGVKAYRNYLLRTAPKLWVAGHCHNAYGTLNCYNGLTTVHNVAMCDEDYKHSNAPHVIEL